MTAAKALPADLIDSLLPGYKKPEDLIGENGLLKQLTKALVERALDAEMEAHLGHAKNDTVINPAGNTRNGKSSKKLKDKFGESYRLSRLHPCEGTRYRHGARQGGVSGARHQHGGRKNCWASGSPRPRARSSGSKW